MKRVGTFITGLLVGATLFGGTVAYAAGIMAEQSVNRFLVDGREVQLNAYAINGSNYPKLRDIGEAVGFNVYWDPEKYMMHSASTGKEDPRKAPRLPPYFNCIIKKGLRSGFSEVLFLFSRFTATEWKTTLPERLFRHCILSCVPHPPRKKAHVQFQ